MYRLLILVTNPLHIHASNMILHLSVSVLDHCHTEKFPATAPHLKNEYIHYAIM